MPKPKLKVKALQVPYKIFLLLYKSGGGVMVMTPGFHAVSGFDSSAIQINVYISSHGCKVVE